MLSPYPATNVNTPKTVKKIKSNYELIDHVFMCVCTNKAKTKRRSNIYKRTQPLISIAINPN